MGSPANGLLPELGTYDDCVRYLRNEGLPEYFYTEEKPRYGIFDTIESHNMTPFFPDAEDLCRLHRIIRERKVFNVMEFGIGYSTLVMADALSKNYIDYFTPPPPHPASPEVRIKEPFTIHSIDSSKHWINEFDAKYKNTFPHFDRIHMTFSECEIGEHNGQICHYYKNLPDITVDFIYVDGPGTNDVKGSINGISFDNCPTRTPLAGDLLRIEPSFLPGTLILFDGRTNNARFFKNNAKRQYVYAHDEEQDVSVFELSEPPLGKINRSQIDYSLGEGYYNRLPK